jgi:hypothetical protein
MPDSAMGPIGGAIAVVPGPPPRVDTHEPHALVDGDMVRLEGTDGAALVSDECYVKVTGLKDRQCALYEDEALKTPAKLQHAYTADATLSKLAKDDVAVVVGISKYVNLTPLSGPEVDAVEFRRWVRSTHGGCVPDRQARLILSSMYTTPAEPGAIKPTLEEMKAEFKRYADLSASKPNYRVGRRLYIFLSGHGITPTHSSTPNFEEPALLAANVSAMSLGDHITGAAYAEWFRVHGLFDEVILFADCCRDLKDNVPPTPPPFPIFTAERDPGRRFYAAATKLDSKAFEKECGDPKKVRGVFSFVLMNALENSTLKNGSGWLTGSILAAHLSQAVPHLQKGQDPAIDFRAHDDIQFVHRRTAPPNASIAFPTEWIGRTATLIGKDYPKPDAVHVITAAPWMLSLELAMYKVIIDSGEFRRFEIDGTQDVENVSFL